MSQVGAFPGINDWKRRTIRAPTNPLDKSTVVSIFPKTIDETKHTIQPGRFIISPGSYDNPALLVVGSSSWWKELEDSQPLLEIPHSSIQIADSIVKDYCNGILGCNMGDTMPGLFYIPGEFTVEKVKKEYKQQLDESLVKQRNWYTVLIKIADTLWARTNGNPISISDDMRLAARELNLEANKEWTKDTQVMELVRCKACSTLVHSHVVICPNCKVILNEQRAKELNLKFAQ